MSIESDLKSIVENEEVAVTKAKAADILIKTEVVNLLVGINSRYDWRITIEELRSRGQTSKIIGLALLVKQPFDAGEIDYSQGKCFWVGVETGERNIICRDGSRYLSIYSHPLFKIKDSDKEILNLWIEEAYRNAGDCW